MHELGVAQEILALVRQYVGDEDAALVRGVRVRVGELGGVVPESLEFCFGAVVAGTPWSGAALEIERVPARARCGGCGAEFPLAVPRFTCPACGGRAVSMIAGRELQVAHVDLADPVLEVR
jgi:hydrogenase nickel incorporation protein HypA/HybF